jgi:FtsZ-interacting cell division protein ZipA
MKNDLQNNSLEVKEHHALTSSFQVNSPVNMSAILTVSTASPSDGIGGFLANLFGSSSSPDGYLVYLLIMCGLFIIGAVLIYNWWEEKRFNKEVEKSFMPIKNDALFDENKKQFLEKFAGTTGYLSDAPDDAHFLAKEMADKSDRLAMGDQVSESHLSIDEVYTELLDTMSKRTSSRERTTQDDVREERQETYSIDTSQVSDDMSEAVGKITEPEKSAQHHTIKSIIDQVFRSKNGTQSANESTQEKTLNTSYEQESILDAYLNAKNAIEPSLETPAFAEETDADRLEATKNTDEGLNYNIEAEKVRTVADSRTPEVEGLQAVANEGAPQTDSKMEVIQAETRLPAILNVQMDLIGVLELPSGAPFGLLADSFATLYKDFDKPVFVHVLDASRQWILVNDTTAQKLASVMDIDQALKIVCSLQLADRSGAVSRNMIQRFQSAFDAIASNMGGRVDWQNSADVFTNAMSLDAFCIEVDKTMFFHLMHDTHGPFTGTKLKGLAEAQGLVLDKDGAFKYFDNEVGQTTFPAFVMFNRDNHPFNPEMLRASVVKAVTFQLDIPHIRVSAKSLDRMVEVAKSLESSLSAILVDDNNRALDDIQIDKIRDQIKSIHATMQLRGITPGSEAAHRLFS